MRDPRDAFSAELRSRLAETEEKLAAFKARLLAAPETLKAELEQHREQVDIELATLKASIEEARIQIGKDAEEARKETFETVAAWRQARERKKLERRASRAEDQALASLTVAISAVEEATYAMMKAVAARLDAEATKEA